MLHTYHPNQRLLTYALNKEGCLVHVDSVPNGNECECVCPSCKSSLCAKNGGYEREHHFAHSKGSDCIDAVEKVLHMMAKEVLQRLKCVRLPAIPDVCESELLQLDEVVVESHDDATSWRPDCIGRYGDMTIWIEFSRKRDHTINWKTKEKLASRDVDCLEIDLNECELDPKQVEDLLINQPGHRVWILNSAIDIALAEVAKRKAAEEAERRIAEEERRAVDREIMMSIRDAQREAEEMMLLEAMNDPRYHLVVDNHAPCVVRNFALSDEYKIFDLRTYDDTAKANTHRYYCLSCGREVRFYDSSNKSLRRFEHVDGDCGDCTDYRYLIGAAQAILRENFYTSETFEISVDQIRRCSNHAKCKLYDEAECAANKPESFDLKSLGYVSCEKDKTLYTTHLHLCLSRQNGMGGDIGIIVDSKHDLLSTPSSPSSSLRLIKIVVSCANDLDYLRRNNLKNYHNCSTYNFRQHDVEEGILDITRKTPRFILQPNGTSSVIRVPFKCKDLSQPTSSQVTLYLVNFDLSKEPYDDALALGLMHCQKKGLKACYCSICSGLNTNYEEPVCLHSGSGVANNNPLNYQPVGCPCFSINSQLYSKLKEKYGHVRVVE